MPLLRSPVLGIESRSSLLSILYTFISSYCTIILVKLKLALSNNGRSICIPREHSSHVPSTGFLYNVWCVASTKRRSKFIFKRNNGTLLYQYFTIVCSWGRRNCRGFWRIRWPFVCFRVCLLRSANIIWEAGDDAVRVIKTERVTAIFCDSAESVISALLVYSCRASLSCALKHKYRGKFKYVSNIG